MLTPFVVLFTLIAYACTATSLGWTSHSGELDEPRTRPSAKFPIWNAASHQTAEDNEIKRDGPYEYARRELSLTKDNGLKDRQASPAPIRPPTVFSTQYVTSTVTTYASGPVTSTVLTTVISTVTLMDPENGQKTETVTVATSPAQQKRTIPRTSDDASTVMRFYPVSAIPTLDHTSLDSSPEKRQSQPATVTSVLLLIERTVITITPTILVTNTATISSTITPTLHVSTTDSLTVTKFTGPDGLPTTLLPSTASLPKTSSTPPQISSPIGAPSSVTLSKGAIAGVVVSSIFGAAFLFTLYLCWGRRKLKKGPRSRNPDLLSTLPGNSSSVTPDATEQSTVIHHESFYVGTSPPASIAHSASEGQRPVAKALPTGVTGVTGRKLPSPSSQSKRAGEIRMSGAENAGTGSSELPSQEPQLPSSVAGPNIFESFNITYHRPSREVSASSADVSLSRGRHLMSVDCGIETREQDGRMETLWRDDGKENGKDSRAPPIPERSKARFTDREPEKTVRIGELLAVLSRRGEDEDGSSAFL